MFRLLQGESVRSVAISRGRLANRLLACPRRPQFGKDPKGFIWLRMQLLHRHCEIVALVCRVLSEQQEEVIDGSADREAANLVAQLLDQCILHDGGTLFVSLLGQCDPHTNTWFRFRYLRRLWRLSARCRLLFRSEVEFDPQLVWK